ncbi:MAG: hypothetical protein AAF466_10685 [Bacteroidota bacterium]
MRKSVISSNQELSDQLLVLGEVVDLFADKDNDSLNRWDHWLTTTESILKKYNFTEVSEISGLRSQLLIEDTSRPGTRSKRRLVFAKYLKTITPAQTVVLHLQKNLEIKIEKTREIIKQLLIAADQLGYLATNTGPNLNASIDSLLHRLGEHEQLKTLMKNAFSMLGKFDCQRLIAEEITYLDN